MEKTMMIVEEEEKVVVVGAGIAGLATSVALQRVELECSCWRDMVTSCRSHSFPKSLVRYSCSQRRS